VVSSLSLPVDPHKVLGVAPGASLQEIRNAYRRQAKVYHPDAGGDDWMFRIVNQAYEYLSTERVARSCRSEPAARTAPRSSRFRDRPAEGPAVAPGCDSEAETDAEMEPGTENEVVRPGKPDFAFDPNMIVEVEKLWIRYPPTDLWTAAGGSFDERFLSCSLNIAWPETSLAAGALAIPDADAHLRALVDVFEELRTLSPAVASNDRVEEGRFVGWLSYASINQALIGFRQLRESLNARGFRLKPWTRDLIIPRDWR
jgi:hypothetical protein